MQTTLCYSNRASSKSMLNRPVQTFDVFTKTNEGWKFTERKEGVSTEAVKRSFLKEHKEFSCYQVCVYHRK
jgi:hypothetical protein